MWRCLLILIACTPLLIFLLPALLLWLITLPFVILLQLFSPNARVLLSDLDRWIRRIMEPIFKVYLDVFTEIHTEIKYYLIDKPSEKRAERVRKAELEAKQRAEAEYREQHTLIYTADHMTAHIPQPDGKYFIEVAEGIERIPENAFSGWDQMREITFPSTLKEIGSCAFENCTVLWEISLPEGVIKVGDNAFRGCTALTRISLPETVTELGKDVFADCPELQRISLPAALHSRRREIIPAGKPIELLCSGREGCVIILPPLQKIRPDAVRVTSVTELIISPGTEIIGDQAFTACHKLRSVELPSTLRIICRKAFAGCCNLETICIPTSVTQIAGNALPRHARIIAEPGTYAYRWAEKRGRLAQGIHARDIHVR